MDLLNKYFSNLQFTIVDERSIPDTDKTYIIYGAGIEGMFAGGMQRYILLFVPSHLAFKRQAKIHELPWENLQTRTLNYSYRLKKQHWTISKDIPDILLNVTNRQKQGSTYGVSEFPFEILLLHDPKKKTLYQYRNKLTLSAALETFSAVVNYIGETPSLMYISGPQTAPLPVNPQSTDVKSYISEMHNTIKNNIPNMNNWFGGSHESTRQVDDSYELL